MRFRRIWQRLPTWAVAAVITVVTLSLAGAVALVTTPIGCDISNRLGANTARCVATTGVSPQPTFTPTSDPSPRPSATPVQVPSPTPTVRTSPSPRANVPPYRFPSSPPLPPYRGSATA